MICHFIFNSINKIIIVRIREILKKKKHNNNNSDSPRNDTSKYNGFSGDMLRAPMPDRFCINMRATDTRYLPRVIYTTRIVQKSVEPTGCHGRATSIPVSDGARHTGPLSKRFAR